MKTNSKKVFISVVLIIFLLSNYTFSSHRDEWQQPDRIMDSIGVKENMTIGEVGAGRGYFTFKLADRVGTGGKIYANDIDDDVLEYIRDKCIDNNLKNVTTILGTEKNPQFADSSLDMAVIMIAFHDFKYPSKMLQNLAPALRRGANVVIIERDPDKWERGRGHFLPLDELVERIEEADYNVVKIMEFLPRDVIIICTPNTG